MKQNIKRNEARILLALRDKDPQQHYTSAIALKLQLEIATVSRTLAMMKMKRWVKEEKGQSSKKYYYLTGMANLQEAIDVLKEEWNNQKHQLKLHS